MKRGVILSIFLLLAVFKGFGQNFFVVTSEGRLEKVQYINQKFVSTEIPSCGPSYSIGSLNNKIYYQGENGFGVADFIGGPPPKLANCNILFQGYGTNALTVDDNGTVYYASGNVLFAVLPNTTNSILVGVMPYTSGGDLIFYKNELYMGCGEGIVKVPLNDPSKSTVYIRFQNYGIYCLASCIVNGKNTIYAVNTDPVVPSRIFQLNMEQRTATSVGTLPYYAYDGASEIPDAVIPIINPPSINVTQECDVFNMGRAEIISGPHNGTYTYTLNTGQSNSSGIFDNLKPGNYVVTIKSTENAVSRPFNFTVKDFTSNNPTITISSKKPTCKQKGEIKLDAGASNSSFSIKYNNSVFGFDHTFSGLDAGTYHFTILNSNGCIADEKDYTLEMYVCPPVNILNTNVTQECNIYNKGHVEIITGTHASQYTFTLSTGQINYTGVFDNLSPGNYQVMVSSDGDELPVNINVVVPDYTINNPVITINQKNPICDLKGSIKLDAGTANASFSIKYNGVVYGFNHIFSGLDAGLYHFTILNSTGCIADEKDYTLVQETCPPIIVANIDIQQRCDLFNRASVTINTAPHPDTYTYTLNDVSNSTGIFDPVTPGTYSLQIASSGGDSKEQSVTVPDYSLSPGAITYKVKNAICTLPGEVKFMANTNSKGASMVQHGTELYPIGTTIGGLASGINHFVILDNNGCIIDMQDVNVPQDECNPVVFPNTFTPNNDGINDFFRPYQDANPSNYKLLIYSRWGALVFQSTSLFKGWDGNYNGAPSPSGVYYWIATYTMPGAKTETQSGYVTLIR